MGNWRGDVRVLELDGEAVAYYDLSKFAFSYLSYLRYRVFAELLEQGTNSTLVIPSHRPVTVSSVPSVAQSSVQVDAGINASHALQHPGYYYYLAARYTESRRERFLAALKTDVSR
jgi:hypothetical protein